MWVGTCPRQTNSSHTTLTCSLICERAWAGSSGLPSPAFSHPTCSRTGRSAALWCSRLPVKFTKEAVMHIAGRIKVGMALVVTNGAEKELAPTALDPLACLRREPHAFGSTTGTILRCAMPIDFDAHYPFFIPFFFPVCHYHCH